MPTALRGLQVVDVLGVFYRERDDVLMVADEFEGTRDVDGIFRQFLGQPVTVLAHHRPTEPHDTSRWGGGSCLFERAGHCPFGHHDTPQNLFVVSASGVLVHNDAWQVQREDGVVDLALHFLVGHRSQVLVLKAPDVDQIDAAIRDLQQPLEGMSLDELSSKMRDTRDLLERVNRLKDGL